MANHNQKIMAHELIRQSAEAGERLTVPWDPMLRIALKDLGADELEPRVFSGNDSHGRQWIVDVNGGRK